MTCRAVWTSAALAACLISGPVTASAQDEQPLASGLVKEVLLDPTTYAPATLYFTSAQLDWASSQPFFRHGVPEHNRDFTISGLPDDTPISYAAGNRKIAGLALVTLGTSAVNNATEGLLERALDRRDPRHRKLWRTLGIIERVSFASFIGYYDSVLHFQQWRVNQQIAAQRGYR